MNTIERNAYVKSTAVEGLCMETAIQIDDFTHVIPVGVDGQTFYAKVTVTACDMKGSKTHAPFSIEDAVTDYVQKCADRRAVALENERKKAEKKAKKTSKTKASE